MPRQRRVFSAESRAKAVLEVPRGERRLAEIVTEPQIQPNLLRAWKADFLENASMVLGRNRDEDQRARLESERREKEA
ncbi:MAG: IS3 family transposase, partial [Succinivibrionaceae bacterium]|nr:IS3 family transposase [Succinivibrionaceae bacterium]